MGIKKLNILLVVPPSFIHNPSIKYPYPQPIMQVDQTVIEKKKEELDQTNFILRTLVGLVGYERIVGADPLGTDETNRMIDYYMQLLCEQGLEYDNLLYMMQAKNNKG